MRFKKMGSGAALQAEEDYVNAHNHGHPGKISVTNYFSLGRYHCLYNDRRYIRYSNIKKNRKIICAGNTLYGVTYCSA